MIPSRLALHGLMLLNPLLACAAVLRVFSGRFDFDSDNLEGFFVLALAPSASAQLATALRWRRIDARARQRLSGWPAGIGIALLTHLIFAALGAVAVVVWDWSNPHDGSWLVNVAAVFGSLFFFSLLFGGALSLPLSALAAQWAAAQRAGELADAA